jgi:DNA-directed RNA polymerase sigma subunit (sigma70/sigma32)
MKAIKRYAKFFDRRQRIYREWLAGKSLAQLGRDYKISRERARQIVNRESK